MNNRLHSLSCWGIDPLTQLILIRGSEIPSKEERAMRTFAMYFIIIVIKMSAVRQCYFSIIISINKK